MSLHRGEVNPLNVFECRKISFIPEHFSKLLIDPDVDIEMLEHWIEYHLNSRYSIRSSYKLDENRDLIETVTIGIEDPKELTMLSLGCQYLIKHKRET